MNDIRTKEEIEKSLIVKTGATHGKKDKCVVYISSYPFIYPTLVSSFEMKKQVGDRDIDIFLYLVDVDDTNFRKVSAVCRERDISVYQLDSKRFLLPSEFQMSDGHVPIASLGRLILDEVLDSAYNRILYLDGDTIITGDVSKLLDFDPPEGKIGAVRDGVWLGRGGGGTTRKESDEYVHKLGVQNKESYFNAGVLSVSRDYIREYFRRALSVFLENTQVCRLHDQSALNIISDGKVEELWPGFNYHTPYQDILDEKYVKPSIIHFTGKIKPWAVRFGKYSRYAGVYDNFDSDWPQLSDMRLQASAEKQASLYKLYLKANIRKRISFRRLIGDRKRLRGYLNSFEL